VGQGDFFAREAVHTQALHEVLDRLRARLGGEAVQSLQLAADYRPERAWSARSTVATVVTAATGVRVDNGAAHEFEVAHAPRPCWLLPEPQPLCDMPGLIAGPERIESGWWDRGDVARDYYLARAVDGARQWVFQDLRSGRWYVQGLWA
jgi:protein ImuB